MNTKLVKRNKLAIIPAGILEGIESFFDEATQKSWVIFDGRAMPFHDAPGRIQRMFADAFLNDKQSQKYLEKKMKITTFREGFERWLKCKAGGLDHIPDFVNGKFVADGYNNTCKDFDCPHRGIFCSLKPGLKNFEVATISALKGGFTIEQTATLLFISVPGLKSRIDKIKEKLGATNMASLIARADEIGI
jgi:DNA-binding CsgD family transcriptional regulator